MTAGNAALSPFAITPPSQEDVDKRRSLTFTPTPKGDYRSTLAVATAEESKIGAWEYLAVNVALVSTLDGDTTVDELNIAGRTEGARITMRLWETEGEGDDRAIKVNDFGDKIARESKAYGYSTKTLVQLFQAVGALEHGNTDLSSLGLSELDPEAFENALAGYAGADVGVRIRVQTQRTKEGKVILTDEGTPLRRSEISDFFTLSLLIEGD